MNKELVIVLDFGGQYNQLVARRVRECNVYCEIYSYKTDLAKIKEMNPKGIILTGGPNSCYEDGAPSYDKNHAEFLANIGVPTFACTPDKFPDLMAAALSKQDIGMWVSQNVKST